jgi:hypothetical protein
MSLLPSNAEPLMSSSRIFLLMLLPLCAALHTYQRLALAIFLNPACCWCCCPCVLRCAGAMGCRLLDPAALSGLLSLLCERDMPVDLLQLLVYMSEDSCRYVRRRGMGSATYWFAGHLQSVAVSASLL